MSAPLVYIITGEPSGDMLGATLMAALKRRTGGAVRFAGIGGEAMRDEGLETLFPMADLAVMGLVEVLPRIPRILGRIRETIADIEKRRPDVVVTVDSWGFTGRIAKALKARGSSIPRVHYVAPQVWAWREGRVKDVAARVDRLLCLLPNEPAYFQRAGLRAVHVGHPVVESPAGDGEGFRERHGIDGETPLLCLLPGSRRMEVARLLPVYGEMLRLLSANQPRLRVVVPTVETVAAQVRRAAAKWPVPAVIVQGAALRRDALAAADVAVAASGTVALEVAMAGLPSVVTYKVSALTAAIGRRLLRVRHVSLVNILMDREVVPELLQEDCTPKALAETVRRLLVDPVTRAEQQRGLGEAMRRLGAGGSSPSDRAAEEVLAVLEAGPVQR